MSGNNSMGILNEFYSIPSSSHQFQTRSHGQQHQQHNQMMFNQQAPPQSHHYGSYANNVQQQVFNIQAWQSLNFETEKDFRDAFNSHLPPSRAINGIQGEELQHILNSTQRIRAFYGINWSLELCKIMIAMLDRSKDGIMQYEEFRELLQCLVYWKQTFNEVDTNGSGFVEANELLNVIMRRYGYRLSQAALTTLLKRYSKAVPSHAGGGVTCLIAFDDFVAMSVRLRAYTEAFRARDRMQHGGVETGKYEFTYDDFLQCTMCL